MKIAFFSTQAFEKEQFAVFLGRHETTFFSERLEVSTVFLAQGHDAVCGFANDDLSRPVLEGLMAQGTSIVGMRCIGLDNVDQVAMNMLGMTLLHVPGYSPYSVAEQAVTMLLGLVRHLPEAQQRVRTGNFTIDGLSGFDLHGRTVGVIGLGRIGKAFSNIMRGFGCKVIAYDVRPDQRIPVTEVRYVTFNELLRTSDIISLHCPLNQNTEYIINEDTLAAVKPDAVLINTGRGRLVDTLAVLDALDQKLLAGYGADVYENEKDYFHYDFSDKDVADELLNRLRRHAKVILTPHQGFLTEDTLQQIARGLLNQFTYYDSQRKLAFSKASMC
ncbi:2-hydroxyacid dehydrogenase [Salmonirosea aquatica]|uniref:2-hydroxyacid dehydrogenase n=1 Tax=Salmonirosea aquatica TaxID=2654236 RepID=A0A7C9FMN2_9BACT|nr:2-hydroxyacid dehydrogenase [Cytophagaceae bacterium SJW1-29]